jgi:hypothetical protein
MIHRYDITHCLIKMQGLGYSHLIHQYGITNQLFNKIAGQCTEGHFLIKTQKKLAIKCVDQVIEFCVKYAPKVTCEHLLFEKFYGGYTPDPPGGRGRPHLHPPARPSAVRSGASRPQLRGHRWASPLLAPQFCCSRTATAYALIAVVFSPES